MLIDETQSRAEAVLGVARLMMNAARTAPKACGIDNLSIATLTGDDIVRTAEQMRIIGRECGQDFFLRDADNLASAQAVVLIGTRLKVQGLNCGLCGFPTCARKRREAPTAPCIFNTHDLGLAVGSAVAIAADHRIDNRVMFSTGMAALQLGLLPDCITIMAIPLSVSGKNPFFDRKSTCTVRREE